jgi:hypothetical protein
VWFNLASFWQTHQFGAGRAQALYGDSSQITDRLWGETQNDSKNGITESKIPKTIQRSEHFTGICKLAVITFAQVFTMVRQVFFKLRLRCSWLPY